MSRGDDAKANTNGLFEANTAKEKELRTNAQMLSYHV